MNNAEILNHYKTIVKSLSIYNPVKTAAIFAGLLTEPELQSNCYRLEVLVQLSLICCKGQRKPTQRLISNLFRKIGKGPCGRMEDPAEDVFVSLVTISSCNYLIFEGLWESGTFYLQRVLNVIEGMPNSSVYLQFKRSVVAILRLSNEIANRAKIQRYAFGAENPTDSLSSLHLSRLNKLKQHITFNISDLEVFDINFHDLTPFLITSNRLKQLATETLGHTTLERYPILQTNQQIHVILPTAISATIRRYTFEFVKSLGKEQIFDAELAREYANHFSQQQIFGLNTLTPLEFEETDCGYNTSVMLEFDVGRYLHLEFISDSLADFNEQGFLGFKEILIPNNAKINDRINNAVKKAMQQSNYKGGLTLIIYCGYGRAFVAGFDNIPEHTWRINAVPAPSIQILEWTKQFSISTLWRILEEQDRLATYNVYLLNMNGLLNLIAWIRENNGHLVPHHQISDEMKVEGLPLQIMISTNALRQLRHDYYSMWDPHGELAPEGKFVQLYKNELCIFNCNDDRPLYVAFDFAMKGILRAVYKSELRNWWCNIECPDSTNSKHYYQLWEMLHEWLVRAIPVLESRLHGLPSGPISWTTSFASISENEYITPPKSNREELLEKITVTTDTQTNSIHIKVLEEFMQCFRYPDNIAETTIVRLFVSGAIDLSSCSYNKIFIDSLVNEIMPNKYSRHIHYITTQDFRDFIRDELLPSPILITDIDDAATKLGLGWRVRCN